MKKSLLVVFIMLLTGCDLFESGVAYTLDNPKNEPITVNLDGKEYQLPAVGHISVELKSGIHTIAYQGESAQFYIFKDGKGGLINPTLSNYYVNYSFYKVDNDGYDREKMTNEMMLSYRNTDTILGNEFSGYFYKYNDLVIEKLGDTRGWSFDVDEEQSNVVSSTSSIKIIGKIFREAAFIKLIKDETGTELLPVAGYQQPARSFANIALFYPPLTMKHECAQINQYFDGMNKQLTELQSVSTDASAREEVRKQLMHYSSGLLQAKQQCPKKDFFVESVNSFGATNRVLDGDARNAYERPEKEADAAMKWMTNRYVFILK